MALQQDVEDLVSESLNGYGLVKRLLEDYSDLRSRASFELQARQRFFEKGFIPELRTYIRTITSISDMSQADLTDLLQQHEQARQRSIQENQAVVAELQEASRELNSALQSYGADMQEADYNRGVYSISRIMQHSKWQPIGLENVVESLQAMKGISGDLHAVDKKKSALMVAYFRDLTGYGKEVLEEAKRHGQEPYRGDIKPEIIAKALFERYAEVDLSLYKEPLWERFKQGVSQTVKGIRQRRAERRVREAEGQFRATFLSVRPPLFYINHTLIGGEVITASKRKNEGWNRENVRCKALARADELGADVVIPYNKWLWRDPETYVEFFKRENLELLTP